MEFFSANAETVRTRREVVDGREYIVAPMTTIVPGVLSGSRGGLLYPPDETAASTSSWDRIPIVIYHPTNNLTGEYISAKTQGVWERQGIGHLQRSVFNGKLQHEGWFDVERLRPRGDDPLANHRSRIHQALLRRQPMELSTGLYTDNEPAANGSHHNGKPFQATARNYKPDHLAILPDQVGACSVRDGCGLNVNAASPCQCDGCLREAAITANLQAQVGTLYVLPLPQESLPAGGYQEPVTVNGQKLWLVLNQGRHQDSGQFLPNKGSSNKQNHTAATRGHAEGQPKKSDDAADAPEDEEAAAQRMGISVEELRQKAGVANANPQGHNQYSHGLTGEAGARADEHARSAVAAHRTAHDLRLGESPQADEFYARSSTHLKELSKITGRTAKVERKKYSDEHAVSYGEPTSNSNPEGHNQYTGGGVSKVNHAAADKMGQEATDDANAATDQANAGTDRKLHKTAAAMHHGAAAYHRGIGNLEAAGQHTAAGDAHRQEYAKTTANLTHNSTEGDMGHTFTANDSPPGHLSGAPRSQVQAAFASDNPPAGGGKATSQAMQASKNANEKGSAASHKKAASAHREAAEHHEEMGNDDSAASHKALAKKHAAKARNLSANQGTSRDRMLAVLTANCSCEQDKIRINSLADETLALLVKNAKCGGDMEDDDDEEDMERNAGDSSFDRGARGSSTQAGGKGTKDEYPSNNRAVQTPAKHTFAELLANADPLTREALQEGQASIIREKRALVQQLVGNIADTNRRNQVGNALMQESKARLNDLVACLPPVANVSRQTFATLQPEPTFAGAFGVGTVTANVNADEVDGDEHLDIPTMNVADMDVSAGLTKHLARGRASSDMIDGN